jgi:hypothetical protein
MTEEAAADLCTVLGRYRGFEYTRRVRRLADRGQDIIVADLQRIRRHGPGRLRAAALEVLVSIVGEAGLHPADLAAAERLVRIKAPLESFLNISLCWDAWLCVRGGDQQSRTRDARSASDISARRIRKKFDRRARFELTPIGTSVRSDRPRRRHAA